MGCILVTGGLGYIGSHLVVELLKAGERVVVLDNLSNSDLCVMDEIARAAGTAPVLVVGDVRCGSDVEGVFEAYGIGAVVHFAGLKAVGESVSNPLEYYENNVCGTVQLLKTMAAHGVKRVVFSSSAAVYGQRSKPPYTEGSPRTAMNPYGQSKIMVEDILRDLCASDPEWKVILLRYFNPVGAHPSGLIGEHTHGIPNNLMPFIQLVACGAQEQVVVYGNDYDTTDGTCVRDYIHIADLVEGHVAALKRMDTLDGCDVFNLGTGRGVSVLELIHTFERVNGVSVPYRFAPRRPGDVACCYASVEKAERQLGWRASRSLEDMCRDAWRWQLKITGGA